MSQLTDTVDSIIKHAIYDVAVGGARVAALAEAPWLGAPVISQVFDFMLGKFADLIYNAIEPGVIFSIIDIQTEAQRKAYDEAVAALKAVVVPSEQGAASAEDIEKAKAEFKKRLGDLIHMHP